MPTQPTYDSICHVCAVRRTDAEQMQALQAAVADWLLCYRAPLGAAAAADLATPAAELLELIARTAREHKRPATPDF